MIRSDLDGARLRAVPDSTFPGELPVPVGSSQSPDATGTDEQGEQRTGTMRYVDGGERYLPGEMPEGTAGAFREEGSVTYLEQPPAEEVAPSHPSPADGG